MPSQQQPSIYDAFEAFLRSVLPEGCKIFQANMPFQQMQSLARETAQVCTWLISADVPRVNSSGRTPVHDMTIEVNLFGTLAEADANANAVIDALVGEQILSEGWDFVLHQARPGRRDIWEPQVQVKRVWLSFSGLVIEPSS